FLGINVEEDLPHPSLLSKFRLHTLNDITLDEIIVEIVRQCVEKGIIEDTGISIDATHTEANTFKAIPERVMKHLAKKIFKTYEEESGELPEDINQNIPEYKDIKDHKEAKKVMKTYLKEEIKKIEDVVDIKEKHKTTKVLKNTKEILDNKKYMKQKEDRSIVDQEKRVSKKRKKKQ